MILSLADNEQVTVSLSSRPQKRGISELFKPYLSYRDRIKLTLGALASEYPNQMSTFDVPASVIPEVRDNAYHRGEWLMSAMMPPIGEAVVQKDVGALALKAGHHTVADMIEMSRAVVDLDKFMASTGITPRTDS